MMQQYIFIIETPPGEAPLWVRQAWVGLTLPIRELPSEEEGFQFGAMGGRPENIGGYCVDVEEALRALEIKNPEVAEWWRNNPLLILADRLSFARSVCRLLTDSH